MTKQLDLVVEDYEGEIDNTTTSSAINLVSTSINKTQSVNINYRNYNYLISLDSYKRYVLSTDHDLKLINYFIKFFNIDKNYEARSLIDIHRFIKRAMISFDSVENEIFFEHIM